MAHRRTRARMNPGPRCSLIVRPPYLIAPDLNVVAFDLTFGAIEPIPAQAPIVCLGGHPAAECLLEIDGYGRSHRIAIAVDESSPRHRLMVKRIKELFDPSADIQVVDRTESVSNRS